LILQLNFWDHRILVKPFKPTLNKRIKLRTGTMEIIEDTEEVQNDPTLNKRIKLRTGTMEVIEDTEEVQNDPTLLMRDNRIECRNSIFKRKTNNLSQSYDKEKSSIVKVDLMCNTCHRDHCRDIDQKINKYHRIQLGFWDMLVMQTSS
jgi:hypothetical protein